MYLEYMKLFTKKKKKKKKRRISFSDANNKNIKPGYKNEI